MVDETNDDIEPFELRWRGIVDVQKALDERHHEILRSANDKLSLILKGHLIAEELLFEAVSAHCLDIEKLEAAKLRYFQLVHLLQALQKMPAIPDRWWTGLLQLNRLRNETAHKLESKKIDDLITNFIVPLGEGDDHKTEWPKPHHSFEALRAGIHYILGGLSLLVLFEHGVEQLAYEKMIG